MEDLVSQLASQRAEQRAILSPLIAAKDAKQQEAIRKEDEAAQPIIEAIALNCSGAMKKTASQGDYATSILIGKGTFREYRHKNIMENLVKDAGYGFVISGEAFYNGFVVSKDGVSEALTRGDFQHKGMPHPENWYDHYYINLGD